MIGIPPKSYTLHIQGAPYLAVNVPVDATNGDVTGLTATLLPGDVNNDNRVDITDLGLLAAAFGATSASPNWNANADLDGNGIVDIADLGLLASTFGKSGDP
jgi:hypothetical protein